MSLGLGNRAILRYFLKDAFPESTDATRETAIANYDSLAPVDGATVVAAKEALRVLTEDLSNKGC